jgi:hypothetical protein
LEWSNTGLRFRALPFQEAYGRTEASLVSTAQISYSANYYGNLLSCAAEVADDLSLSLGVRNELPSAGRNTPDCYCDGFFLLKQRCNLSGCPGLLHLALMTGIRGKSDRPSVEIERKVCTSPDFPSPPNYVVHFPYTKFRVSGGTVAVPLLDRDELSRRDLPWMP